MSTALLAVPCAGCGASSEVEVAVGDQRVFKLQCGSCSRYSQVTLDAAGLPLLVAEGPRSGSEEEGQSSSTPISSVPPKKRRKSGLVLAPNPVAVPEGEESKCAPPASATASPKARQADAASGRATADSSEAARKQRLRRGSAVIAQFSDGYYYSAIVEEVQGDNALVAWDDGDPSSWVNSQQMTHKHRTPAPSELHAQMAVLSRWNGTVTVAEAEAAEEESNVWFPATIIRRVEPNKFELVWDDGDEKFFAGCKEIRLFLSSLHKPPPPSDASASSSDDEAHPARGLAVDLLRRSGRDRRDDAKPRQDPSDSRLLRRAMGELRAAWAGASPATPWAVATDVRGVPGLAVCADFLDAREVEALRTLFGAHRAWAQYSYGETGRHGQLASVVQRIDFGPAYLRAEGVVGGTHMWPLGGERAELLRMVGERLRHVFGGAGLWRAETPDTLQLTRIGCAQKLANHFDRRDRWLEGIATVAWSELPCEADLRGDAWTLNMERGSKAERRSVQIAMQPGSAYILMGAAQGCTKHCERRCVGHNRCNCCWTHGVLLDEKSVVARQSMTMRVLADTSSGGSEGSDDDASRATHAA